MERVYVGGGFGQFSPARTGCRNRPIWADLQAEAAAKNLYADWQGMPAEETFKVELVCIVDSQNSGMLVARTMKRNIVMPNMRLFHWLKRLFEWWYLRQYR